MEQKARRGETGCGKQARRRAKWRKEGGKGRMEKESGSQRAALARVLPATGARQTNVQRL